MRQRNKVLETDSPTAKFLYTIIKQLDLKSIDWNRVASDLDVSNGHAARMRYSRFRQQMEGTTGAARTKRKSKKEKNVEPPPHMQGTFPMGPTLVMPMEPMDSSLQSNPFVKCEPGTQGNPNLQSVVQYSLQSMPETAMQAQYYLPQEFASTEFQLASNMPSGLPSHTPATSSFMNPYQAPTMATSYPYTSSSIQSDLDMREFEIPFAAMNVEPTITWEPRSPSRQEGGPIVKIEEEQQDYGEIPSIEVSKTYSSKFSKIHSREIGFSKPKVSKPKVSKPKVSKLKVRKFKVGKTHSSKFSKTHSSKSGLSRLKANKFKVSKFKASKFTVSKLKVSKNHSSKIGFSKPKVSKPKVSKPKVSKLKASKLKVIKTYSSKVSKNHSSKIGFSKPKVSKPKVSKLKVSKLKASKLKVIKTYSSKFSKIHSSKIGFSKPKVSRPKVSKPKVSKLKVRKFKVGKTHSSKSGLSRVKANKLRAQKLKVHKLKFRKVGVSLSKLKRFKTEPLCWRL
ncbi:hypothetical protein N7457_002679 [Penicillium paradoxum]|uniref:uncharacterized protein n=1 Tax=Penicillium paradoxum TaxID=176176 RepID=UPI00254899A4|nr:uncharacterized protein N7457_002679 [Penicillium paradoxum]KAJ5787689.1 hypothetical protein N7457_002679 [Penicillium paradoxum]